MQAADSTTEQIPELSIIVPMFNEADGLDALFSRLMPCLRKVTEAFEVVCVNDGSRDATLVKLREYAAKEPRIKVVSFSRNFGKELALTAGIDHSKGRAVVPIDADLQDPPELIEEMVKIWREGTPVVLATRESRPGDSWLKRKTAEWFYTFMRKVSTVPIPPNTGDFRLMDRKVVDSIVKLRERTRFMKGIFAWVGYPSKTIYYTRPARAEGRSRFNLRGLWRFALDGIFSFTTVPLRVWTYIGAFISLISFVYAIYVVIKTLILGVDVPGYPSLMVVVLFMGGIQLISLGIIGEYVGRIYKETKNRPLYVVHETIGIQNP